MTQEQWNKLVAFIKSEANAAHSILDARAEIFRRECEEEARQALVKELQQP